MSDFLVDLNPSARQWIGKLGLPVPLPEKLRRQKGPWQERPLKDRTAVIGSASGSVLDRQIAETVIAAGASAAVVAAEDRMGPYAEAGEAWGQVPRRLEADEVPGDLRAAALLFDATGIESPADLKQLYDFFHPRMGSLTKSGRLIVLARPSESAATPVRAATQAALTGFIKSCGRELGRRGSTAQLVMVDQGAEHRVGPALRWLMSDCSAFITGQVLHISGDVTSGSEPAFVRALEGKVALVTGAARGIGAACAATLAREGAKVICLDRPEDDGPLAVVAREIGGAPLLCDVTAPDADTKIAEYIQKEHGHVDIVVHNAGVTRDRTLKKMSPEAWDLTMDVNLGAIIKITGALDPLLAEHGRIICLSSVAGISGNMGQTNYAASKAGVIGFVQSLAKTMAGRGIAVNAVAPGFIETRLTAAIPVATREAGRRLCNLSQGGLPEDIAEAITFLASPGAAGLSGRTLRVCGGSFLGA